MALEKFNWQNGSQVEPAKVEVEGVSYDVVDAQYEGETPLSAANLNLMQDTLLSNVKDDLEDESKIASCKAVKDINSTTETKTNKVWIDNKPIYRNFIYVSSFPNNQERNIAHGISNIDKITNISGVANDGTRTIPLPFVSVNITTGSASGSIYILANNTNITLGTAGNRSAFSGYIILEYTKTTD